jgi:hypothetical protein
MMVLLSANRKFLKEKIPLMMIAISTLGRTQTRMAGLLPSRRACLAPRAAYSSLR